MLKVSLRCFACGEPITSEDDLVIISGCCEEEFQVPSHRDCAPEDDEAGTI
jgi:hypothetical protein